MFRRNLPVFEEAADPAGGGGTAVTDPPAAPDPNPPPNPQANIEEQLNQLRSRLEAQERVRQAPQPPQPPPQSPPPRIDKKALQDQFYQDPIDFMERFGQVVSNSTRAAVMNEVSSLHGNTLEDAAKQRARGTDPELWDAFEPEITAAMQEVPSPYRANTTVWMNAFNNVKGANIQKAIDIKGRNVNTSQGQQRGVPDGPASPSHKPVPAPRKAELTADEKQIIQKMQTTEESYRLGKEALENPNAFWSKFITFDSRNSRRTEHPTDKKGGR